MCAHRYITRKKDFHYYLITNLENMCQVKERQNNGAWKDDICNEEYNVLWLPFIPWVPHGWEPYNIRHHKGHDDQRINNIPPFGLVDVKSLPTDSKDFLHKKTEHKGQYSPVWKRNKDNLGIAFRQDYKIGDRLKTRTIGPSHCLQLIICYPEKSLTWKLAKVCKHQMRVNPQCDPVF